MERKLLSILIDTYKVYKWDNSVLLYMCTILYGCRNTQVRRTRNDIWLLQLLAATAGDPVQSQLGQTDSF